MLEPLDPSRGSEEPDNPQEEEGRCNTRALDLGAVRAIHRAAQGAGGPRAPAEPAQAGPGSPRSEPASPRPPEPRTERSKEPLRTVPTSERPALTTIEVDYSPTSRKQRVRGVRVQRGARVVVVGAVVAAVALVGWAVLFGKRGGSPLAANPVELSPVGSGASRSSPVPAETPATSSQTSPETGPLADAPSIPSVSAVSTGGAKPEGTARPMSTAPRAPTRVTPPKAPRPASTSDFPNQ